MCLCLLSVVLNLVQIYKNRYILTLLNVEECKMVNGLIIFLFVAFYIGVLVLYIYLLVLIIRACKAAIETRDIMHIETRHASLPKLDEA